MEIKKTYTADLENKKSVFYLAGIAVALCLILVAFEWKIYEITETVVTGSAVAQEEEELVPITRMENLPPPPPPPPQQLELQIVDDEEEVAEVDIKSSEDTKYEIKTDIKIDVAEEPVEAAPQIYDLAALQEQPEFPGGLPKMYEFIGNNVKFPQMAKENGIQGKVYVKFVVWKDGSIRDVQVLKGIGGGCDEEAVRVVKEMPKWIPGKQMGKAVAVYFHLPIVFNLR